MNRSRGARPLKLAYAALCLGLLATTFVTGRRVSRLVGGPSYLFTKTRVYVEQRVEPTDATDAALDALFEEAGDEPTVYVETPVFVLGLLDATIPAIAAGGLLLAIALRLSRRRGNGSVPTQTDPGGGG